MYHVVEFHADGGQMCVPGRRVFTEKPVADSFAEQMRNEEGHSCGPESVRQYESFTDPGKLGDMYRPDVTPEKFKILHETRLGIDAKSPSNRWRDKVLGCFGR